MSMEWRVVARTDTEPRHQNITVANSDEAWCEVWQRPDGCCHIRIKEIDAEKGIIDGEWYHICDLDDFIADLQGASAALKAARTTDNTH